jgi:hypothetical protein
MSNSRDDIEESYDEIKGKREYVEGWLDDFYEVAEGTYDVFREIMREHENMGKAAIIIMAHHQAGNLLERVRDGDLSDEDALVEMIRALAPMYEMFYDRYTRETIENLDKEIDL